QLLLLVEIRHLRRRFDGCPAHGGRLSRGSIAGNGHFSPRGGLFVGEAAASPIAEIAARRKRMGINAVAALCGGEKVEKNDFSKRGRQRRRHVSAAWCRGAGRADRRS